MINDDSRNDSLEGLLQELSDAIFKRCQGMLPCVVTKVSDDRKRVSVRPLIRMVGQNEEAISRDIIEGLAVFQAGAGDFVMSFNVSVDDLGWIEANDRDISLFLQSYEESDPPTRRKHSFSDARFIPDIMTNFTIAEEDAGAVVIQNREGTVKISLDQEQIRVKNQDVTLVITDQDITADAPGNITISAGGNIDVTAGGSITMTAPAGINLNGASIPASGDVITASGVSLDGHFHTQANDSAGNVQQNTSASVATE